MAAVAPEPPASGASKTITDAEALVANVPGITIEMPRESFDTLNFDAFTADNTLGTMGTSASTWSNPFGLTVPRRGSFAIKRSDDEKAMPLLILHVGCQNRMTGDMQVQATLPDGTVFATFSRTKRCTLVQSGDSVLPVTLFGSQPGQIKSQMAGSGTAYMRVPENTGIAYHTKPLMQQPKCLYMCASCVCFFPTCSIGSIIIMCMMQGLPTLYDLKTAPDGQTLSTLKLLEGTDSSTASKVTADFGGMSAKQKLDALLVILYMAADAFTAEPRDNTNDGAGAPDTNTMER